MATLFTLQLQPAAAASSLDGTVFLVILATTVSQGGYARHIAEAFGVTPRGSSSAALAGSDAPSPNASKTA